VLWLCQRISLSHRPCVIFHGMMVSDGLLSTSKPCTCRTTPCWLCVTKYVCSCCPYLKVIFSLRNLRMHRAIVAVNGFNICLFLDSLTPNDHYRGRTAPLTSKRCILYIYSKNIGTEYFKHGMYSLFLSLENAVCFIILTYLVPVLFTFYIRSVLKLKKNNSGAKQLIFKAQKDIKIKACC